MKKPGLKSWFLNLGIREKLLLCFFILIMLPSLAISVSSYCVSRDIIEQKTNRYSHDILQQTTNVLEGRISQLETISFNIFIDLDIQKALNSVRAGTLDSYHASLYSKTVESVLAAQVLYHEEVESVYVVALDGTTYSLDKTMSGKGLPEAWTATIRMAEGSSVWFSDPSDGRTLALARYLYSVQTQKPLGYLIMYVSEDYLSDVLTNTRSVMDGSIYAVDESGQIVIDPDSEDIGAYSDVENTDTEAYSFTTRETEGKTQYVALSEPMVNGWRVVSVVDVVIYEKEIRSLRSIILLVGMLVFFLSIFFAWALSRSIYTPIRRLTNTMTDFGEGQLSVRCSERTRDEVGSCATAFNQMAENINQLISKVYQEQLMKRDAELKSLRMQINPHFLYNTLETINWMARTNGNEDVGILSKSLGDLMRATINGKDTVSLAEEITSLNYYLQIQKYRYGDKFDVTLDISEETKQLYLPKLIIQPLVENAIYHGVAPALGHGVIYVSARRDAAGLHLTVTDNGVGMEKEQIDQIIGSDADDESSIGLRNVIKRIKTLYGPPYGLCITSEIGEGTEIRIWLPVIETGGKGTDRV